MTTDWIKLAALSVSCVALLVFSPSAQAQDNPMEMSLSEAVSEGVMTNPEYGVVAASRRATDEELNQARGLWYPSIDFRGDTGYEYTDDVSTRAGVGDDTESLWRYNSSLTLTQMLFDGWATKYENERQKHRVQSSAHRVKETAELVGLSIVEFFLEVMRQRELLDITRENVAEHVAIMAMIEEGVNAGRSTQADMEQIKARLASARAQESSIREQLRIAESSFHRAVGDMPKDLVLPAIPVDAISADVEQEVMAALTQSPTLDIVESDIDVAYAEYQATGSTLYPELDLQLNATQGDNLGGVKGRDTSASALLVVNWNLYRGGADMARVREFTHRHQQAKESRDQTARALEDDVRQTWARMVSSGERASQFSAQAAANAEVVRAYKDQFSLDRRTLLDVLDAQNELFVSRTNTINAEFLEMFSIFRLVAVKGQLLPTLGVAYPRESDQISVNIEQVDR
ncbi:MAG: TolC family outer membrane protein [Rhodospirillales bacterium]|nr:TolC family outer membrane protein [Alphaproteobacteria bacterium]USO04206.1 MAG: TolC family outer membrane protein [Rhodospirillales bacterium]